MSTPRFPLHHGIRLAAGGFLQNLNIEQLATDPAVIDGIRVWYNTTDRQLKFTTQDGLGGYTITSIATLDELNAATADLEQQLTDLDTTLRTYVDNAVDSSIADLSGAFRYIGKIETAGGDLETSALDLETLSLTDVDSGAYYKLAVSGWFKKGTEGAPFYANVGDAIVFNNAGGVDVFDNTNSEVSGTADEIAVTGSTDTGFVVELAEAVRTKLAQIETLSTTLGDVQTEMEELSGAVLSLIEMVGQTHTLETEDKTSLTGAVNELHGQVEALVASSDDTSVLKDVLNALVFTFDSSEDDGVAQVSYDILHNLNTQAIDVSTWVQDPSDTLYYNDIVSVGVVDANTIRVSLSEARHVRVTIRSAAALD